jgi:hypothetical protein
LSRNKKDRDKSQAVCYTTGPKVLAEVKQKTGDRSNRALFEERPCQKSKIEACRRGSPDRDRRWQWIKTAVFQRKKPEGTSGFSIFDF